MILLLEVDGNGGDDDSVIALMVKLLVEAAALGVLGIAATLHSGPILGCKT